MASTVKVGRPAMRGHRETRPLGCVVDLTRYVRNPAQRSATAEGRPVTGQAVAGWRAACSLARKKTSMQPRTSAMALCAFSSGLPVKNR